MASAVAPLGIGRRFRGLVRQDVLADSVASRPCWRLWAVVERCPSEVAGTGARTWLISNACFNLS